MGYVLRATVPNTKMDIYLELGKQYYGWDDFNDKWFGQDNDGGVIFAEDFDEFLEDIEVVNDSFKGKKTRSNNVDMTTMDWSLYNLEHLEEMMLFCKENNYELHFISY